MLRSVKMFQKMLNDWAVITAEISQMPLSLIQGASEDKLAQNTEIKCLWLSLADAQSNWINQLDPHANEITNSLNVAGLDPHAAWDWRLAIQTVIWTVRVVDQYQAVNRAVSRNNMKSNSIQFNFIWFQFSIQITFGALSTLAVQCKSAIHWKVWLTGCEAACSLWDTGLFSAELTTF